jgi:hypothetical protein
MAHGSIGGRLDLVGFLSCRGSCTAHLMHRCVPGLRLEMAPYPSFGPPLTYCTIPILFLSPTLFSLLLSLSQYDMIDSHLILMSIQQFAPPALTLSYMCDVV